MYGFNKSNLMPFEMVFEILGEGGGICIYRQKNETEEKFLYNHSEFDPTDEGLNVNKTDEYKNFETPFQLINNQYPWYILHIKTVHDDYRNYIIERLIEKINEKSITQDYLGYSKSRLEECLRIKLAYKLNNGKNIWSYTETDE